MYPELMPVKNRFLLVLVCSLFIIGISSVFMSSNQSEKVNSDDNSNQISCNTNSYTGEIDVFEKIAIFEGGEVSLPSLIADNTSNSKVLGVSNSAKWVEVDLSDQKLIAWEGDRKILETKISSGLSYFPTPTGEFRVWIKLRAAKMEGGSGKYYYYLPNVPYVMYFSNDKVPSYKGYGLHGAYWHNEFGTPRSHGCVNLPIPMAKQLYEWIDPVLPAGKNMVRASDDNPGTRVVIHE